MDSELDTIRRILSAGRYAFVTTRTADGALHSRPLALLDREDGDPGRFDGTLWFFTGDPSSKVADIAAHSEVNVAVGDGKGYLSMSGSASIEHDRQRIDRLWNRAAGAFFPNGKDDPAVALLRVEVDSVEYWDTDEAAPKKAFELAKGLLTRRTPDLGDTGTVRL